MVGSDREENRARALDLMSTEDLVRHINDADEVCHQAVQTELPKLAEAADQITARLTQGGRLTVVGAGTSGRLAALDASELWPTYGFPAARWRAFMAGGNEAFLQAQEGAEDDEAAGVAIGWALGAEDVLLGVAASGRTPFVGAAMKAAQSRGALVIGLFCTPGSPFAVHATMTVVLDVGPEVVSGSTRMKAGTAQKMALNLLSTTVMVRLHHVLGTAMIDMKVTNRKLLQRARNMVRSLAGVTEDEAARLLDQEDQSVRRALARYWTKASGSALDGILAAHPNLRDLAPPELP